MTPDVARAVMAWHLERRVSEVCLLPGGAAVQVTLLPPVGQCPPLLLDYLLQRFGSDRLVLTHAGWGIAPELQSAVVIEARDVLKDAGKPLIEAGRQDSRKDDVPKAEAAPTKPSPPPINILRRRGFVVWRLCDPTEVEAQLERVSQNHRERKRVLEALRARPVRYLPRTTAAHVRTVMDLRADFPNFSAIIEVLADGLSLRARMKAPLKLPPALLMGESGLGKTVFCKELAGRLGFELCVRSLAELSAAFVLIGGSPAWSESRPGLIAVLLADLQDDRAPLLMLDELDKVRSGSHYPPDVSLLGLLEDHTARAFREENLDLQLDLEPMSFLLTGNRLETIRPEILSRLQRTEVRMPTREEMRGIVASVDKVLRHESPALAKAFEPLSDEVMACLSARPPRAVKGALQRAYASVSRRHFNKGGRLVLTALDMKAEPTGATSASASESSNSRRVTPLLVLAGARWRRVH